MSQKKTFLSTTIGKKTLMAATGLMLIGFLTSHLAGNFLLLEKFGGKEAFNNYAHWLISHPMIIPMEIGLFAIFIIHIVTAIKVSLAGKAARPQGYAMHNNLGKSSIFSRTMIQSGSVILIFLVLHLSTFKFGSDYRVDHINEAERAKLIESGKSEVEIDTANAVLTLAKSGKADVRDLHKTVVENFAKKWYSIVYILCMIVMGFHLAHGFKSAFQTLGLNHPKYNCCIAKVSNILAFIFAAGYSVFPIYFGFIKPFGG
jgi:succinate dehydrogenase / fumarate reductase, cytochrome b subunit